VLHFIIQRWRESLGMSSFRYLFFGGLLILAAGLFIFTWFLQFIQARQGFVILDPVITRIGPYHLCTPIMLATYLPVVFGLGYLSVYPSHLMKWVWAYAILMGFRAVCMYLVPLEPPATMIELRDMVLEATVYQGNVITKDLFFSGHVAVLFLFSLTAQHRSVKVLFLLASTAVAAFLVMQHVHYTIDVFVAPVFAFFAYKVSGWILKR
jgi:hypothetical protein